MFMSFIILFYDLKGFSLLFFVKMTSKCLIGSTGKVHGKVMVGSQQNQSVEEFVLPLPVQVAAINHVNSRLQAKANASAFLKTPAEPIGSPNNRFAYVMHRVYRKCCKCSQEVEASELFVSQMSGGMGFCRDCRSDM